MIKLRSILNLREVSEPEDSDQWENWRDYVDYFHYGIDAKEIHKLIQKYKLSYENYDKLNMMKVWDQNKEVYLEYDIKNETFDWIRDINDWVSSVNSRDVGIDIDEIYSGYIEGTLGDIKKEPGNVYHYTTDEGLELIEEAGEIRGSYGTGINNRGAYGIFTSVDPEEHADGSYGDICLEIDLGRFKVENNLSELNLNYEPEVEDYLIREYIYSILEIEDRDNLPSDISPYTIVVNHNIPIKYIRKI